LEKYIPSECYVIQSGKNAGKVLERMMFQNYGWIPWQLNTIRKEGGPNRTKGDFEKHLEELLERGENRKTTALCPHCKQREVSYLSVVRETDGVTAGKSFTCCDNQNCIKEVEGMTWKFPQFLDFKFSIINTFRNKSDQKIIANVLKWGFGIEKLTKKDLFNFFWK
jgi:hypothetical protein